MERRSSQLGKAYQARHTTPPTQRPGNLPVTASDKRASASDSKLKIQPKAKQAKRPSLAQGPLNEKSSVAAGAKNPATVSKNGAPRASASKGTTDSKGTVRRQSSLKRPNSKTKPSERKSVNFDLDVMDTSRKDASEPDLASSGELKSSTSSAELTSSRTMVLVGPPSPIVPEQAAKKLPIGESEGSNSDIEERFAIFAADETSNSEASPGPSSPIAMINRKSYIETTPQNVKPDSEKIAQQILESDSDDSDSEEEKFRAPKDIHTDKGTHRSFSSSSSSSDKDAEQPHSMSPKEALVKAIVDRAEQHAIIDKEPSSSAATSIEKDSGAEDSPSLSSTTETPSVEPKSNAESDEVLIAADVCTALGEAITSNSANRAAPTMLIQSLEVSKCDLQSGAAVVGENRFPLDNEARICCSQDCLTFSPKSKTESIQERVKRIMDEYAVEKCPSLTVGSAQVENHSSTQCLDGRGDTFSSDADLCTDDARAKDHAMVVELRAQLEAAEAQRGDVLRKLQHEREKNTWDLNRCLATVAELNWIHADTLERERRQQEEQAEEWQQRVVAESTACEERWQVQVLDLRRELAHLKAQKYCPESSLLHSDIFDSSDEEAEIGRHELWAAAGVVTRSVPNGPLATDSCLPSRLVIMSSRIEDPPYPYLSAIRHESGVVALLFDWATATPESLLQDCRQALGRGNRVESVSLLTCGNRGAFSLTRGFKTSCESLARCVRLNKFWRTLADEFLSATSNKIHVFLDQIDAHGLEEYRPLFSDLREATGAAFEVRQFAIEEQISATCAIHVDPICLPKRSATDEEENKYVAQDHAARESPASGTEDDTVFGLEHDVDSEPATCSRSFDRQSATKTQSVEGLRIGSLAQLIHDGEAVCAEHLADVERSIVGQSSTTSPSRALSPSDAALGEEPEEVVHWRRLGVWHDGDSKTERKPVGVNTAAAQPVLRKLPKPARSSPTLSQEHLITNSRRPMPSASLPVSLPCASPSVVSSRGARVQYPVSSIKRVASPSNQVGELHITRSQPSDVSRTKIAASGVVGPPVPLVTGHANPTVISVPNARQRSLTPGRNLVDVQSRSMSPPRSVSAGRVIVPVQVSPVVSWEPLPQQQTLVSPRGHEVRHNARTLVWLKRPDGSQACAHPVAPSVHTAGGWLQGHGSIPAHSCRETDRGRSGAQSAPRMRPTSQTSGGISLAHILPAPTAVCSRPTVQAPPRCQSTSAIKIRPPAQNPPAHAVNIRGAVAPIVSPLAASSPVPEARTTPIATPPMPVPPPPMSKLVAAWPGADNSGLEPVSLAVTPRDTSPPAPPPVQAAWIKAPAAGVELAVATPPVGGAPLMRAEQVREELPSAQHSTMRRWPASTALGCKTSPAQIRRHSVATELSDASRPLLGCGF